MSRQAAFLDRDGVLNEPIVRQGKPYGPASPEELVVTSETRRACAELRGSGLLLIMVTNQPDIARGRAPRADVDEINDELRRRLRLDDVFMCPHDDGDGCACRKPQPGMLLDAASRWAVSLGDSVMVGDRWRDIEAGRGAGCATVLVERGYDERQATGADHVASSLGAAVPWILAHTACSRTGEVR